MEPFEFAERGNIVQKFAYGVFRVRRSIRYISLIGWRRVRTHVPAVIAIAAWLLIVAEGGPFASNLARSYPDVVGYVVTLLFASILSAAVLIIVSSMVDRRPQDGEE